MLSKVVFSVKRSNRYDDEPIKGVGYISDSDLIVACMSKNNKPYVRVFENCLKYCKQVIGSEGEYKGTYQEFYEIDNESRSTSYDIWYKTGGIK